MPQLEEGPVQDILVELLFASTDHVSAGLTLSPFSSKPSETNPNLQYFLISTHPLGVLVFSSLSIPTDSSDTSPRLPSLPPGRAGADYHPPTHRQHSYAIAAHVWKQCNKEENMSVRINWVHPNIKFVTPEEGEAAVLDAAVPDVADPDAAISDPSGPGPGHHRRFNFNALPAEVQARIFKLWLFKKGKLIHVISRLDPFVPNEDFPEEAALRNRSGLKNVFFGGERRCNITDSGQNPNSLLRVLLVCRRFFFIGIHCFYGLNSFAFSSLGEFSRFCQGIGPARVSRLQHLEITLMGNQYLTVPLDRNGRIPVSRRTSPLSFLLDCHRLKSLVIFVNESEKTYTRCRYENSIIQDFMVRQTAGQPNQRKHRALRCIQGMDFIYALRGLEWIRFYDLYKAIASTSRTAIREPVADWSFVEDVTNTATMQKVPSRRESSRLENLEPLFSDNGQQEAWNPGQADWELVKSFYIDKWSYDQLRQDSPHIPSHMSASSDPRQGHSLSSSSSSSSSGPHHGRAGPALSAAGSSMTDAIDLGNSESTPGPNTETDLPPRSTTGRVASVMIELSSDSESDSDDDNLFVSQRNCQPQYQHQLSPTPHPLEGGPSVTVSVPARLHSLTPMGSMTSSLLDRGFSVPANLGRLETPSSGLITPRGPQSFASLLNIQPASSAARYLPPNNPAALESASVVASRRGSMSLSMSRSLSRSLSRSVSRSVSRSGSLVIERGNGNGSRAGSASTYRIRLRYRSSGSSGSDLFVRQTPRLSERESVDLTNVDEDGEDDGHGGGGGGGLLGRSRGSESGNGELMTIDEGDDENGDQDMEGRDSGYEGADDSDVEMVDSV
ncbi:hypothetical protein NEUTE1DRAFT_124657 [Neurospora tetrasperma FGSC 2508]|uniref:Uncharacterized protein n=1 Tax=Neurospora tetrasperma (strain FGSC 2508 / ATCC MYA-4615 / P0657) TaxID=510951 RepID=F8MXD4_NEUT8|nr:uncharacterized protein NEUTE1DRAFT_124657 [Neurospora tetrasperma FGSC 2508]EGO54405.1 hypothetical protein NEUTE1DRAFT_124657 [Neurospora tetrasperma FGSC 2508]